MEKLLKKYVDTVGRIVSVYKNTDTKKYTICTQLGVSMITYSFNNRAKCMEELRNKYKRETRIFKNYR